MQSPNLSEYNRPATWQTEPTTHWRAERLGGVKVILKKGKLADIGTMYSLTEDGDVLLEPIDARWIDVGSISVNAPQGVWVDLGTLVRFTEPTRQNLDQYRTRTPAFEGDLRFSGIAFNFYNLFGASMDQDINGFMYANYRMQDGYLPIQLRTQEWDCTTNIPSQYYFPDIAGYWSGRPPNLALRVYKNKDPGPAPAGNQIVIPVLPASYWATVTGRITAPGVGGVDGATVSIDGCGGTRSTTTVNGDYTLTKVLPSFLKESHPCDTCTNKWRQLTILIATDTASVEFIRGTVHRDSESGPFVEGASVTITTPRTYPATTDGSGYFNVDQPAVGGEIVEYSSKTIVAPCLTPPCPPTRISQQMQLSPGYTAMAVVKKAGYAPTTRGPQTLSPRTGWDLGNIPLIQLKVTVTGRLTDAAPEDEEFAGQPIYDKSIQVWNEDRDDWVSTTTAPSGRYTFQDLPVRSRGLDGPYYVTIQVPAGTGLVRPYGDLQRPPVNRYYDTYGPRDLPQPNLTQVNTAAPWTVITIDLPLNGRGQL
ncbi:MAG: carboxypeptidase regulatory-like domain-containing protein [Elusimicrobia bacterium]|nr:carboxypeptidase regulatory-like domain-containing protein [Elusimicrobiota bacterium]